MECSTGYHHPPHSQAPVHTTSVIKLCFRSLYNTAVACVALGCAPVTEACLCLRSSQNASKANNDQNLLSAQSFPLASRREKMGGPAHRMTQWSCRGSRAASNSSIVDRHLTPRAFLALFGITVRIPLWLRRSCIWSAHNYFPWLLQDESTVE